MFFFFAFLFSHENILFYEKKIEKIFSFFLVDNINYFICYKNSKYCTKSTHVYFMLPSANVV